MKICVFLVILGVASFEAASLYTSYVPLKAHDQRRPQETFIEVETGLYQQHPSEFDHLEQQSTHLLYPSENRYLSFVAPPDALVAYVPIGAKPWTTANVFVKGQGYSTNRYVAPSVMQRYLATSPR